MQALQADLDAWIEEYNTQRTKHLAEEKMPDQIPKENAPAPIQIVS